jgi:glycerol-3-phosphate dehydrogenase
MILQRFIEQTASPKFDAVIIGGGITGAAVAYAAASRGLHVALFEKSDFGGATSAATSKLIHGGLRYLANFELKLVRESLQERRILGNIAPNFVYPVPFMLPSYRRYKGDMWKLMAGMYLYDWLSFDKQNTWDPEKSLPNHKIINKIKTLRIEPDVVEENLRYSTIFYDYQSISPERLTLSFLKSAVDYGAKISNYSKVEDFVFHPDGQIKGVVVKDLLNQQQVTVETGLVINCGGTWADVILNRATKKGNTEHKIKRSEGIHVITPKIAGDNVISLVRKDGGHMMIMPWRGYSLIGTTDKEYLGSPDHYKVSKESIDEVINAVNENYGRKISYSDIKHAYGGLRPLIDNKSENSYTTSRKYEVYDNEKDGIKGMITVEGGKYTTSRNLAHHVMDMVGKKLQKDLNKSITYNLYLTGSEIRNMGEFMKKQHLHYSDFSKESIEYISRNYGTFSRQVFDLARFNPELKEMVSNDGELLAEVSYAISNEMAKTLKDIMLRRTGIGTLGKPSNEIIEKVMQIASKMLHWDEKKQQTEFDSLMKIYDLPI